MKELTESNQFKWGYGPEFAPFKRNAEEEWRVAYGPRPAHIENFKTECLRAAQLIAQQAEGPLWLCLSGGVDSEVMVRVFLEAKIPFHVAILRFTGGDNDHDVFWANQIAESLGLNPKIIDLDLRKFFSSGEAIYFADLSQSSTPEMLATMWLVDQLDGDVCLGSGECYLVRSKDDPFNPGIHTHYSQSAPWFLIEKESVASWYKFYVANSRGGAPGFFQYTAGQIHSYFEIPVVRALVRNQLFGKLSSSSSKQSAYQYFWPVETRTKFNGYEKTRALVEDLEFFLVNRLPRSRQIFETPAKNFLLS